MWFIDCLTGTCGLLIASCVHVIYWLPHVYMWFIDCLMCTCDSLIASCVVEDGGGWQKTLDKGPFEICNVAPCKSTHEKTNCHYFLGHPLVLYNCPPHHMYSTGTVQHVIHTHTVLSRKSWIRSCYSLSAISYLNRLWISIYSYLPAHGGDSPTTAPLAHSGDFCALS
jgi:hypothetical protein